MWLQCAQYKHRYGDTCFYFIACRVPKASEVWRVGWCICIEYVNACFGRLVGGQGMAFFRFSDLKDNQFGRNTCVAHTDRMRQADGWDSIQYMYQLTSLVYDMIPDLSNPLCSRVSSDPTPDRTRLGLGRASGKRTVSLLCTSVPRT